MKADVSTFIKSKAYPSRQCKAPPTQQPMGTTHRPKGSSPSLVHRSLHSWVRKNSAMPRRPRLPSPYASPSRVWICTSGFNVDLVGVDARDGEQVCVDAYEATAVECGWSGGRPQQKEGGGEKQNAQERLG
eukprot:365084-Chlamydomonas_euryale.AAC.10